MKKLLSLLIATLAFSGNVTATTPEENFQKATEQFNKVMAKYGESMAYGAKTFGENAKAKQLLLEKKLACSPKNVTQELSKACDDYQKAVNNFTLTAIVTAILESDERLSKIRELQVFYCNLYNEAKKNNKNALNPQYIQSLENSFISDATKVLQTALDEVASGQTIPEWVLPQLLYCIGTGNWEWAIPDNEKSIGEPKPENTFTHGESAVIVLNEPKAPTQNKEAPALTEKELASLTKKAISSLSKKGITSIFCPQEHKAKIAVSLEMFFTQKAQADTVLFGYVNDNFICLARGEKGLTANLSEYKFFPNLKSSLEETTLSALYNSFDETEKQIFSVENKPNLYQACRTTFLDNLLPLFGSISTNKATLHSNTNNLLYLLFTFKKQGRSFSPKKALCPITVSQKLNDGKLLPLSSQLSLSSSEGLFHKYHPVGYPNECYYNHEPTRDTTGTVHYSNAYFNADEKTIITKTIIDDGVETLRILLDIEGEPLVDMDNNTNDKFICFQVTINGLDYIGYFIPRAK